MSAYKDIVSVTDPSTQIKTHHISEPRDLKPWIVISQAMVMMYDLGDHFTGTSRFTNSSEEGEVCCSSFLSGQLSCATCIATISLLSRRDLDFHCLHLAVADILLWNDRNISAGVLAGATLIWYLFDVIEYNIIPLLCQIAAIAMLVIFIWSNAAPLLHMYGFLILERTQYRNLPGFSLQNFKNATKHMTQYSTNLLCIAEPLQESQKSSSLNMPSSK